ncbi:MAG: hypothetical protein IKE77_03865 [Erysipelotrichaceae bacterium]|nr:hypothetical protein [Erysipelotrichaceae bacterium]
MKYGESAFDVLYLAFAISSGIIILSKAKSKRERYMDLGSSDIGLRGCFPLGAACASLFR